MGKDAATIFLAVILLLLSLIGALALIIFNDIRNRIGRVEAHLSSLLSAYTPLSMRNELVEGFLERELDYHPPDLSRFEPR